MTVYEKVRTLAALGALSILIGCDSHQSKRGDVEIEAKLELDVEEEKIDMIKLYKKLDGHWHYHEAWVGDGSITEHWGRVGNDGESDEHKFSGKESESDALTRILKSAIEDGYQEVKLEDHAILVVEYKVDGFGTTDDLDKRHRLEDRMGGVLGWPGLGHCDGGSIGSDTMEIACFVIDFDIAKRVVEEDLKGTEFEDFTRIYNERDTES